MASWEPQLEQAAQGIQHICSRREASPDWELVLQYIGGGGFKLQQKEIDQAMNNLF